jgi:hypothetical protein
MMPEQVRYRNKIMDAGMPMPALILSMPMPSYANLSLHYPHYTVNSLKCRKNQKWRISFLAVVTGTVSQDFFIHFMALKSKLVLSVIAYKLLFVRTSRIIVFTSGVILFSLRCRCMSD